MGMTIDESFEWLISRKEHYEMDDNCQELAQALELAIDTMRKYQKIRDKISTIYVGYRHGYEVMADVMEILREVEDGKID